MKTVLVVDDNKCVRDVLSLAIESLLEEDIVIRTAENGAIAAEIFDTAPVSAVMTDLSMPVMDGYELVKHVRNRSGSVPVIVLTGQTGPEVKARLRPLGVAACLEKPFDIQKAVQELASALGLSVRSDDPGCDRTSRLLTREMVSVPAG